MTLGILGTGGHARSIYDIIKKKKIIYFFDKNKTLFTAGNKRFKVQNESELLNIYKKKINHLIT